MNYANKNKNYNENCFHCNEPINSHAISLIQSSSESDALAISLQSKLDGVYKTALLKGYVLPQGQIMTGAIIATVGSAIVKAAALSGANADTIFGVMKGGLGKGVNLVGDNVSLASYRSILDCNLTNLVRKIDKVGTVPPPSYPVGSCAAQKLVNYLVQYSLSKKMKITNISMSEIFWKTNSTKSNWSTGETVPSCNTCQYVLPMMLCNYDSMGNKQKY